MQTYGGYLGGVRTRNTSPVGEIELRSESCTRLRVSYRFNDTEIAGDFRNRSGEIALQRIADDCSDHR
jgi:hypothetical protein